MADARKSVPTEKCPQLTGLSAASGSAPLQVTFHASVENASAVTCPYRWDFGDGSTAETTTPSTSGTYTASVTTGVPSGCPATNASTTVTVTPAGSA